MINTKHNLTVLYAEDEEMIRLPFTEMLERRIQKVIAVPTGEEAYEVYRKGGIDMLITDIKMPGISGFELAAKIRKEDQFIPIIVTTAYEFKDYLMRAIEVGINKYLVKPINKASLTEALDDLARMVSFKRNMEECNEILSLILKVENRVVIWSEVNEKFQINSDFLKFFGFDSYESFFGKYANVYDFFKQNSIQSFNYSTTEDVQWIDSFMKINGVEKNTILNLSETGFGSNTNFRLRFKLYRDDTRLAFVLSEKI